MSGSFSLLVLSTFLFAVFLVAGFICAIVVCIQFRQDLRGTGRYIIPLAATLAALLFVAFLPTVGEHPWCLLLVVPRFAGAALYAGAGLALARHQGFDPLPLLSRAWSGPPGPPSPALPPVTELEFANDGGPANEQGLPKSSAATRRGPLQAPPAALAAATAPVPPPLPGAGQQLRVGGRLRPWVLVLVACVVVNVYSLVLIRVTGAQPSRHVQRWLMSAEERESYEQARSSGERWRPSTSAWAAVAFADAAIMEEVLFRLFWLTFFLWLLRRVPGRQWVSISLVSAMWALGHTGVIEPPWVKLLQIFVVGLVVGHVYLRAGTEGSVLVHLSLNLVGPRLISW